MRSFVGEEMDYRNVDMEALVDQILREVQAKIEYEAEEDERIEGTVALFTTFVPSRHACAKKLTNLYGAGIDCALFEGVGFSAPGFHSFSVRSDEDKDYLMDLLAGAADVVLVTPKLSMLYRLAEGEDDGFVEQAFLRPLLWGRNVTILLDFDIPRFKRATFFAKVVDAIDVLVKMGVRVEAYRPSRNGMDIIEAKTLVTEADVLDAYRDGSKRIICDKDALITPLAKDKAAELDVKIDW